MTQTELLLRFLQAEGASITSYEAYERLFITQLGRCLSDLERQGHRFTKTTEEHNGKHFKRYALDRAGEQLRITQGELCAA